jgi:hypothetical protein
MPNAQLPSLESFAENLNKYVEYSSLSVGFAIGGWVWIFLGIEMLVCSVGKCPPCWIPIIIGGGLIIIPLSISGVKCPRFEKKIAAYLREQHEPVHLREYSIMWHKKSVRNALVDIIARENIPGKLDIIGGVFYSGSD